MLSSYDQIHILQIDAYRPLSFLQRARLAYQADPFLIPEPLDDETLQLIARRRSFPPPRYFRYHFQWWSSALITLVVRLTRRTLPQNVYGILRSRLVASYHLYVDDHR